MFYCLVFRSGAQGFPYKPVFFFNIDASISPMQATHASAVFFDWRPSFQQSVIRLLIEQQKRQVTTEGSKELAAFYSTLTLFGYFIRALSSSDFPILLLNQPIESAYVACAYGAGNQKKRSSVAT